MHATRGQCAATDDKKTRLSCRDRELQATCRRTTYRYVMPLAHSLEQGSGIRSASASAAGGGSPAGASGAVGRQEALLGFVVRETNKTGGRKPKDDYDELDKI
ncbi:hypothetical protein MRX96_030665 [Rhipicephalus microplus]